MREEEDQIWLKPNADADDIQSIWVYALTVDGYRYADKNLGIDCPTLANQRLEIFQSTGLWQGSFEELRCCLFYEQRRWRNFETTPTGKDLVAMQALFLAISASWETEVGDSSD